MFLFFSRAEELETALMEMVKQDNRRQLSARVCPTKHATCLSLLTYTHPTGFWNGRLIFKIYGILCPNFVFCCSSLLDVDGYHWKEYFTSDTFTFVCLFCIDSMLWLYQFLSENCITCKFQHLIENNNDTTTSSCINTLVQIELAAYVAWRDWLDEISQGPKWK